MSYTFSASGCYFINQKFKLGLDEGIYFFLFAVFSVLVQC